MISSNTNKKEIWVQPILIIFATSNTATVCSDALKTEGSGDALTGCGPTIS